MVQDFRGPPDLDNPAHAHHRHAMGKSGDHAKVMGDEQDRHACPPLQVRQKVEDLQPRRGVERGDRLVGDENPRRDAERSRDSNSLPLSARKLMREAVEMVGPEPDIGQQPDCAGA